MPTATSPGTTSGSRICSSTRIRLAPSILAASSRDLDSVSKKLFISVIASGSAKVVSARIRPRYVSSIRHEL